MLPARLLAFTLSMILIISTPALAVGNNADDSPGFFAMTGDLVVARPVLLVATILGSAIFVVSSPFSALGGNIGEAADILVKQPAKATFMRCLGCPFPKGE